MKMFRQKNKKTKGFTIIETVISIAIFVMIAMALLNLFRVVLNMVRNNKAILIANSILVEELESVRGMDFNNVATVNGFVPAGPIANEKSEVRSGVSFIVKTDVSWVDDPFDALKTSSPADPFPYDYKKVRIRVSWRNAITGSREESAASTNIAPDGSEEISAGHGAIFLTVLDSDGDPVADAIVNITSVSTAYFMLGVKTDANGNLWIPGLDIAQDYHVTVTKAGYSTDQTYAVNNNAASPDYNPVPVKADLRVIDQKVTDSVFVIDMPGSMEITTVQFSSPNNWRAHVTFTTEQIDPAVVSMPGGDLMVAFSDTRDVGNPKHIRLQRLHLNLLTGSYDRVWASDFKTVNQLESAGADLVVSPINGSLYLVWNENTGVGDSNIFLKRINPVDGSIIGSSYQVNQGASRTTQVNPSVAADANGNLFVVWEDNRNGNWDIYARKFITASNTFSGADFRLNSSSAAQQLSSRIITDNDAVGGNDVYVVWESNHSGNYDVLLSKFDNNWAPLITEKKINDGSTANQYDPDIAYDGGNNFYIVWADERNTEPDIFAQKMTKSGVLGWSLTDTANKLINDDAFSSARRLKPSVAYRSDGEIYIAWEDNRNGSTYSNIYTSKIDNLGVRQWQYDFMSSNEFDAVQTDAIVICDAGGKAVVFWQDNRFGNSDIYGARYNYDMASVVQSGVPITVTSVKKKGTRPDAPFDIPKYSKDFVSDVSGKIYIPALESGEYNFSIDDVDYCLISTNPPFPLAVNPGSTSYIVIDTCH